MSEGYIKVRHTGKGTVKVMTKGNPMTEHNSCNLCFQSLCAARDRDRAEARVKELEETLNVIIKWTERGKDGRYPSPDYANTFAKEALNTKRKGKT